MRSSIARLLAVAALLVSSAACRPATPRVAATTRPIGGCRPHTADEVAQHDEQMRALWARRQLEARLRGKRPPLDIPAEDAVRLAEEFVLAQGYTDAPPSAAPEAISHEMIEPGGNQGIAGRRNTLKPTAAAVALDEWGWVVGFEFTSPIHRETGDHWGRKVRINLVSGLLRMVHEDACPTLVPW